MLKIIRNFTAWIAFAFLLQPVFAQAYFDFASVCSGLAAHANTAGKFVQKKVIKNTGRPLVSSGVFVISKDCGIVWDVKKPFPSVTVIGASAIIQTSPDGSKSVIELENNQTFSNTYDAIASIFTGDTNTLYENFDVRFRSDKASWSAALTPKSAAIKPFLMSLKVNGLCQPNCVSVTDLTLEEANGSVVYEFSDQQYPLELSADEKTYFSAR